VITLRLRDIGGSGPVTARVRLHDGLRGGLASVGASSLCEDVGDAGEPVLDGAALVQVPACGLATVALRPGASAPPATAQPAAGLSGVAPPVTAEPVTAEPATGQPGTGQSGVAPRDSLAGPGPAPEPAQPVHARYWLHGKGAAPAGNMPLAVHLSPAAVALDDGQAGLLHLTIGCGPAPAAGAIRLQAPPGFALEPAGPLRYDLTPFSYQGWDLTVTARPGMAAGRYFAVAQIEDHCGQLVEDSALLAIGQPLPPIPGLPLADMEQMQQTAAAALAGEAELSLVSSAITVRPGSRAPIEALLRNRAGSAIRGEAQLISPIGSWHLTQPWTTGFALQPGAATTLRFEISVPATARPGERWWALVKVMYFGRLRYTDPVEVSIVAAES
jgi:hypothetical protein